MLNRSTAVVFVLGFACAALLVGCGNASKGAPSGKDAADDARPAIPDTAADANSGADGDTPRANDSAPDTAPDLEKSDGAPDVVAPSDVNADSADVKDVPASIDGPGERTAAPDGSRSEATPDGEVGKSTDAPADGDGKPGIDGNLPASCQGILLDETFQPPTYPVLYREPADANATFTTRTSALLSTYGLGASDYTFDHMPVSWAATLQQGNGPCTLGLGEPISAATFLSTARSFLSKWGDLFQYKGNDKEAVAASCAGNLCMVTLAQDYCGLPVRSRDVSYGGDLRVDAYIKDSCLWRTISHFVPMVPIPKNVLLSEAQLKHAVLGLTLTYSCKAGQQSVQVSAQDTFTMPATPTVFVRKSATIEDALEYRLAVGMVVTVENALPWTLYVDGLDGTVIDSVAGFICD
jgi:hypothetical protein